MYSFFYFIIIHGRMDISSTCTHRLIVLFIVKFEVLRLYIFHFATIKNNKSSLILLHLIISVKGMSYTIVIQC